MTDKITGNEYIEAYCGNCDSYPSLYFDDVKKLPQVKKLLEYVKKLSEVYRCDDATIVLKEIGELND